MSYSNFIDSIASLSKLGIEGSDLNRDDKEYEKAGIDCLASILKQMAPQQRVGLSVMGLSLEWIKRAKESAHQHSVERVVLIPYPNKYGIVPLVRVYGGNKESFFDSVGLSPRETNISIKESKKIDELEKEYGVILYVSN